LRGRSPVCITQPNPNGSQLPHRQKGRVASPVPDSAPHARFAPVARLTSTLRRHLGTGGLSIWLLKAAVRHAAHRKARARSHHSPEAWRTAWERGGASWPAEPVTGIIEAGATKLVIDRCEITGAGHLWLDGWALDADGPLEIAGDGCTVEWQATFATARADVVQTLQLSLVGTDANVGYQILARIADYVPGRSRLALIARNARAGPRLVVPVVPQAERSGSVWQSVYDAMRQRGPRDVTYLETSVRLLKEMRKVNWRDGNAAICRSIDNAMPESPGLKVLVLSRLHPNAAYLNLQMLAAARLQPAAFIVCSMGQAAIQRANEYRTGLATLGAHDVGFVSAEIGTPSCELIEQFARSCQRRGCAGLVIYDDVAVASAMGSLGEALRQETMPAMAWPRQFPQVRATEPVFAVPLAENDGAGPFWRSARAMEHGGLGAVLFDPADLDIPPIPPFEGRGFGLEYLVQSALPGAILSGDTMLDLVDSSGQREAQGLDLLMLLASRERAA
jgi:hypothetical protein